MGLGDLLNQSASVKNPSGTRDKHGQAGLGSATTVSCRFEKTSKTIVTADREREPIDAIIGFAANANVQVGAQITYDSQKYRALVRKEAIGGDGSVHHIEVMAQLWSYAA